MPAAVQGGVSERWQRAAGETARWQVASQTQNQAAVRVTHLGKRVQTEVKLYPKCLRLGRQPRAHHQITANSRERPSLPKRLCTMTLHGTTETSGYSGLWVPVRRHKH